MGYKTGNSIYSNYMMSEEEYDLKQLEMEEALQKEIDFKSQLEDSQEQILNQSNEDGNPSQLTNQDAATVLRLESYKTNPDMWKDYSDDELVQRAKELNHPLANRMVGNETPGFYDIAKDINFKLKKAFLYDWRLSIDAAVDNVTNFITPLYSENKEKRDLLKDIDTPIPAFDFALKAMHVAHNIKNNDINSNKHSASNFISNSISLKPDEKTAIDIEKEKFFNENYIDRYKAINGVNPTQDLIDFDWASLQQHAKNIDLWEMKTKKKALELEKEYLKNNPQAFAVREWWSNDDTSFTSDGFSGALKWASMVIGDAVSSQLLVEGMGAIGGLIGSINPGIGTFLGYSAGVTLAGATLNGGEYTLSEIDRLSTPTEISNEGAMKFYEQERDAYINNEDGIKDIITKEFGHPLSTSDYMALWNKTNIFQKDGKNILIGMSPAEASSITEANALVYMAIAGLTENISSVTSKFTKVAFPGYEKLLYDFNKVIPLNILARAQDKLEARARRIVTPGIGNRVARYAMINGIPALNRGVMEGFEEVLQGLEQSAIQTMGPMGMSGFKHEYYEPDFEEVHGGLKQIKQEFAGGFLGATVVNVNAVTNSLMGRTLAAQNKSIIELSKSKDGMFYAFEYNKDTKMYDIISIASTEKDGKIDRIVEPLNTEDIVNPDTGEQISSSYRTKSDASHIANLFNLSTKESNNKIQAYDLRDVKDGEAKIEKNENDKWVVNIYDNNGNLFEKGKEEYNKKGPAQRVAKQNNDFLFQVKRTFDKFGGLEGLQNDDVIKQYNANQNLNTGETKNTPSNVSTPSRKLNDLKIGVKNFLLEDLSELGEETMEIADRAEKAGIDSNPDIIINTIRLINQSNDQNTIDYIQKNKERIFKRFDIAFDEDSNYIAKRKSLENQLNLDETRVDKPTTEEKPPSIEQEIKVDEKPETTVIIEDEPESIIKDETQDEEMPGVEEMPPREEIIDDTPEDAPTQAKEIKDYTDKELDEVIVQQETLINVSTGPQKSIAEGMLKIYKEERQSRKVKPLESKEDMVTIPGTFETEGKPETMTRKEAEKRLKALEADTTTLTGEEGSQDQMLILDEINALKEGLGKKKKKIDIAPTKKELDQQRKDNFERTTKDIFNRLISNIKLKEGKFNLEFIDDSSQDSGWIQGKTIYINKANVDIGTALHEISHPIVTMLRVSNPKLFNNIYKEVIDSRLIDDLEIRLQYGSMAETDIQEEIVVRAIEKIGKGNLYKYNSKNKLVRAVQDFFDWLFEKLGLKTKVVVFGSEADILTPSTTIKELTDIITNFKNKYEIHLDEKAFDDINEISNDELNIITDADNSLGFINSIVSREQEVIKNVGVSMLIKSKKKDPSLVLEQWIKSIEKTYKITRRKYGGKWHIKNKKAIEQAKELIQNDLVNALGGYKVKNFNPKKFNDKMIEVAGALVLLNEKVEFHYKPIDILLENPNALYTIDDMLIMPGIKKNEQGNIKKFVSEFKKENPGIKSLKRSELADLYLIFSNKQTGLSYIVSHDWSEFLSEGYNALLGRNVDADPHQTYRMVAHMNKSYTGGTKMLHSFKELDGNTGVGWYAVVKTPDGGRLLHEYQSDVLMEFLNVLKNADNISDKTITENDLNKFSNLKDIINNPKSFDNKTTHFKTIIPNEKNITNRMTDEMYFNGLSSVINSLSASINIALNSGVENPLLDTPTSNFEETPPINFSSIYTNLSGVNTIIPPIDFKSFGYQSPTGNVANTFNFQAQEIMKDTFKEAEKRLNPQGLIGMKLTENQILTKMEEIIIEEFSSPDAFNVVTGFSQKRNLGFSKVLASEILKPDSEFNLTLNQLNKKQYIKFPEYRIVKHIADIMFSYGENNPYTKQDKKDLYEFWEFMEKIIPYENQPFVEIPPILEVFPNKENSFYKYLLKVDNQQSDFPTERFGTVKSNDYIQKAFNRYSKSASNPMVENEDGSSKNIGQWLTPSGNIKPEYLTKNKKLKWETLKQWRKYQNPFKGYKKEYQVDKATLQKLIWIKDILEKEGTVAKTFDFLISNIVKSYTYKALKMNLSLLQAYSVAKNTLDESVKSEKFELSLKDSFDSSMEYKAMKDVQSLSKNWFSINILHSIRHSYLSNPDAPIYLNTGEVITMIEGSDIAKSLYNTTEEAKWDGIKRYIKFLKNTTLTNELSKANIINNETAVQIFSKSAEGEIVTLERFGRKLSNLSLKESYEVYNKILDFMINESKDKEAFKSTAEKKIKLSNPKTGKYISVPNQFSLITGLNDKLEKLTAEETISIEESIAEISYNILPTSKGIFTKELDKVNKKYDLNLRLVFPEWSTFPMWQVDVKNPDKLLPYKYKKILKKNIYNKTRPQNKNQIKLKIKRKIDLDNLDKPTLGLYDTSIVEDIFKTAWKEVNNLRGSMFNRMNVDVYDFREFMLDSLSGLDPILDAFEDWFNKNFADKVIDKRYAKHLDKRERYHWVNSNDINETIVDVVNELDDAMTNIVEQVGTDEREVSRADLETIKELNITLKSYEIKKITASVKSTQYKNYESWKKYVLPNIFKRSSKFLTKRQENALHKFYNRVYSSIKTNGNIELVNGKPFAVLNEQDNLVIKKHQKFDDEIDGYVTFDIDIENKGPINVVTGNQNNQFVKTTLYEFNVDKQDFIFIGGGDVLTMNNQFDENGFNIKTINPATGNEINLKDWGKSYEFFNEQELNMLEEELNEQGLTIAFVRGDSKKIGVTRFDTNEKVFNNKTVLQLAKSKSDLKEFWANETSGLTEEEKDIIRPFVKEHLNQSEINIAKDIAVYLKLKKVFPEYILDPKGASNIFKRIKIPFTPVTISPSMPDINVAKFNPKDVLFKFGENQFNPLKSGNGIIDKYFGDGAGLSSKNLFVKFEDNHGLASNQGKLKTVIYDKFDDTVVAIKFNHILVKRGFEIIDRKTKKAIWRVDEKRNIYAIDPLGDGKDVYIDMLVTDDEVKVTNFADLEFAGGASLSGQSIGVIKFAEKHKNTIKHIMQWYNYVDDESILTHFREVLVPKVENNLRKAFYLAFSEEQGKLTKTGRQAQKSIAQFLNKLKGKNIEGYDDIAFELAKVGAGLHPSIQRKIDKLVQTQIVDTIINMGDSLGSIYDVSPDFTGQLKSSLSSDSNVSEVSLSVQNSKMIIDKLHDLEGIARQGTPGGKKLSVSKLNELLEKHEVNVMITRSPIVHKGGAFMARVKNLHERASLAELNWRDVFIKLEGDNDGDEIHIELLSPETEAVYKPYLDSLKVKGVNLNNFATGLIRNPLTQSGRFSTISNLTAGQNAISEISNVALIYGIINKVYNGFKIKNTNVVISVKQPNEMIDFPEATYLGKKGAWEGTVEDYLRIWLQAAADNNEFGLLSEWNYNRNNLLKSLFNINIQNPQAKELHLNNLIEGFLNGFTRANNVRKGQDSRKKYGFKDTIKASEELLTLIGLDDSSLSEGNWSNIHREEFLSFQENADFVTDVKDHNLTPLEHLSILPVKLWSEYEKQWKLFGYEGSPYYISMDVHKNAHINSVRDINRRGLEIFESKVELDKKLGNFIGTPDSWAKSQNRLGKQYAESMSKEYLSILKNVKVLGTDTMNYNTMLISWMELYDPQFKALSETAKAAATIYFLRGFMSLQNRATTGKNRYPISIPPVSINKKNISLLDASIIKVFFNNYNEFINSESRTKIDRVGELKGGEAIEILIKKACGG